MRSNPAYATAFAFITMTILLIIVSTGAERIQSDLADARESRGADDAYLAAWSAADTGHVAIKDYNAGYETSEEKTFCLYADGTVNSSGDGDCATWGNYTVYSKAATNTESPFSYSGMFFTPIPGTGTAGDPDDCSVLNDHEDVDHPCNWNKLMYGDSVTIPLYSDDGSGGISVPADLGLDGWILRVRTPCDPDLSSDIYATDCTRYTMNEEDSTSTFDEGGDSVIFWQLVGESDSDGDGVGDTTVSVVPDDEDMTARGSTMRDTDYNTEVYEELINESYSDGSFEVMEISSSSSAPFDDIYNTCVGDLDYDGTTETDLSSLSLQLDIVTPLLDGSGDSIPYLEWQLITDSTDAFGDTKAVIVGEGYHQGNEGIFYYPVVWTRSTTGESTNIYTLSN